MRIQHANSAAIMSTFHLKSFAMTTRAEGGHVRMATSTAVRVRVQHPEGTDVLSVSPLCTLHELHSAALALHASASGQLLAGHPPRELDDEDWVTMVRNGQGRVLLSTATAIPVAADAAAAGDAEQTSTVTPAAATAAGDTEPGTSPLLLLGLDGDMLATVSAALGLDGVLMMRATCRALAHVARRALRSEAWRGRALQMVYLGHIGEAVATGSLAARRTLRPGLSYSSALWSRPMAPKVRAVPTCLGDCRSLMSSPELA
jgi:hypothetical protein